MHQLSCRFRSLILPIKHEIRPNSANVLTHRLRLREQLEPLHQPKIIIVEEEKPDHNQHSDLTLFGLIWALNLLDFDKLTVELDDNEPYIGFLTHDFVFVFVVRRFLRICFISAIKNPTCFAFFFINLQGMTKYSKTGVYIVRLFLRLLLNKKLRPDQKNFLFYKSFYNSLSLLTTILLYIIIPWRCIKNKSEKWRIF